MDGERQERMAEMFTREMFAKPDDEAGIFMIGLGGALVTWAAMQLRPVTVHDAAAAFNTTPEIIAEAIENDGDSIELDGD